MKTDLTIKANNYYAIEYNKYEGGYRVYLIVGMEHYPVSEYTPYLAVAEKIYQEKTTNYLQKQKALQIELQQKQQEEEKIRQARESYFAMKEKEIVVKQGSRWCTLIFTFEGERYPYKIPAAEAEGYTDSQLYTLYYGIAREMFNSMKARQLI